MEKAANVDQVSGPGAFPTLDMKVNIALTSILAGSEIGRLIRVQEERYDLQLGKRFSGRQMLWEIYRHYATNEHDKRSHDFVDIMNLKLARDDLAGFLTQSEMTLSKAKYVPSEEHLEYALRMQLEGSSLMTTTLEFYKYECKIDESRTHTLDFLLWLSALSMTGVSNLTATP